MTLVPIRRSTYRDSSLWRRGGSLGGVGAPWCGVPFEVSDRHSSGRLARGLGSRGRSRDIER